MRSIGLSLALDQSLTRRILILHRNAVNRRAIRLALESRFRNITVAECDNATAAAEIIQREPIDAVLIDGTSSDWCRLSDGRGSRLASAPILVVITSMDHLASAVNDFSAADYVIRPFNLTHRRRFLVSIGTRDIIVNTDDLAWVRANGYCATLVLRDRREYLVRLPLDQLENELDPDMFIRIHRSAIVRFDELQELERSASRSVRAVLRSGARIPVSRSRRDALIRALGGT